MDLWCHTRSLTQRFLKTAVLLSVVSCATVAQWAAPKKKANREAPPGLAAAEKDFWDNFHAAKYDQIPRMLETYNGMYVLYPENPVIAARLGFLHVWRLAERMRFGQVRATVIEDATLCHKFFAEANRLDPDEARYKGFLASCIMAEADIHRDEVNVRRGYFLMKDAISDWPEFNLFTGGYVVSHRPWNDRIFAEGLDYQWETMELCSNGKSGRHHPDYTPATKPLDLSGKKRACGNSMIAPHNFEGFFLNMGDMLVKQGNVENAKQIYANARLSPTYNQWPYKDVLEERIKKAADNVKYFRVEQKKEVLPKDPHIMFHSDFACMGCHRGP